MKKLKGSTIFRQCVFSAVFSALFAVNLLSPALADPIQWGYSYDAALKLSARDNKPVMAFFYTSWCGYCRKMDAETFQDRSVIEASVGFITVRIDAEKYREVSYRYGLKAFPAILFLDSSGRVIWREYGFREAPMLAGRMKEVLSVFKKNAASQPYLHSAFEELGRGNADNAIAIISEAIRAYPDDQRLYAARGAVYLNKADFDRALGDFDAALSLNPADDNVYTMRGIVYYKKRDFDKALADCDKAISINRWAYEAYNGRGIIYLEKGEPDLAIKNFNTVLLINPQNANAYFSRGLAYASKREFDKAAGDLTMAIIINPDLLNAYSNRAYAYFMMKDYDKSWSDVNEVERRGHKVNQEFLDKLIRASGRERPDEGYDKYKRLR